LDNEIILRQFEEIEKKVEKLIDINKSLEAKNLESKNNIRRLEEELQGKVDAETNYTQEKALIRSKIDSLLVRLEDITEIE
jgi:protein-arginine kinase activator protein McsA